MKIAATLFVALLPALVWADGNGVERGSIREAIFTNEIQDYTKDQVSEAVHGRCALSDAVSYRVKTETRFVKVDQFIKDILVRIEIQVDFGAEKKPEMILVDAIEYDIANPLVQKVEIRSVTSPICR